MLSVMLFLACRDAVRNVAIIGALMVGLCVLAVTPLISIHMLDIQSIYPGPLVWGRSLIRLGLAALLFYLRPREAHSEPVGGFLSVGALLVEMKQAFGGVCCTQRW